MARKRKKKESKAKDSKAPEATSKAKGKEAESAEQNKIQEEIEALRAEAADFKEKYMRARAELDNFRKRKVKDIDDTRRNSRIATIEEFLPVLDQFQMAMAAIESATDIETIKMGMTMIQNTFNQSFENLGVERIQTVGEEFDPLHHEAVSMEASEDVPTDHIIREWKAGFKLGDYLLRAPAVVVSSGPESEDEDEDELEDAIQNEAEPEEDDRDVDEPVEEMSDQ